MNTDYRTLEYHTILEQLANFAVTETARERIRSLTPCLSELELTRLMRDTTQARRMLDTFGSPSLPGHGSIGGVFRQRCAGGTSCRRTD